MSVSDEYCSLLPEHQVLPRPPGVKFFYCVFLSLVFLHAYPARKLERTGKDGRSKSGIINFIDLLSGLPAVREFWTQYPAAINLVHSDCWRVNWRKTLPSLSSAPFQISTFLLSFLWLPQLFATCSYPSSPLFHSLLFPFALHSFFLFPMTTTGK